jgi:MFS family permease
MSDPISLKGVERMSFQAAYDDGLWDVFLGCFFLMFAIAPFLSSTLGDFWSTAIFLPFWGFVFLAILVVRKLVVAPRIGKITFGKARRVKLMRFAAFMLILNILAAVLGVVVAANVGLVSGQLVSVGLGFVFLFIISLIAYAMDFYRYYVYAFLIGFSPLIGEWLWNRGLAPHHGFPITFGVCSVIMILAGLAVFFRLVRNNPLPSEGTPPGAS